MECPMDTKQNDHIIIQLNNGTLYDGKLLYFCSEYVEIYNVRCGEVDDFVFPTSFTFYAPDIAYISKISNDSCDTMSTLSYTSTKGQSSNCQSLLVNDDSVTVNNANISQGSINIGDKVKITDYNGDSYVGIVELFREHMIIIKEAKCYDSDEPGDNSYTFDKNNVQHLVKLITSELRENNKNSTKEPLKMKQPQIMRITQEHFNQLRRMVIEYKYIRNGIDNSDYNNAIEALSSAETIGITVLGSTSENVHLISLIAVATVRQIYIFDVLQMGITDKLIGLLESNDVTKVVHDKRPIIEHLRRKQHIQINNVFDIQSIDQSLRKSDVPRDLSKCLNEYLHVPTAVISTALELDRGDFWNERPILKVSGKLHYAAQLVAYLLTLHKHLVKLIIDNMVSSSIS